MYIDIFMDIFGQVYIYIARYLQHTFKSLFVFKVRSGAILATRVSRSRLSGRSEKVPGRPRGQNLPVQVQKIDTLLDLCVSSLRRGHANLLCIVPILTDDPRRESNTLYIA